MPWACERCATVHTQNPAECRNCGHRILEPVGAEELNRRSDGVERPSSAELDDNQVMGTASDPEYESAPDVSTDGSLSDPEPTRSEEPASRQSALGSAYRHVRATVRAPFGLLREYAVPLLAFLLVGLGVAYLLGLVP